MEERGRGAFCLAAEGRDASSLDPDCWDKGKVDNKSRGNEGDGWRRCRLEGVGLGAVVCCANGTVGADVVRFSCRSSGAVGC